jgi:hypothetical protein
VGEGGAMLRQWPRGLLHLLERELA